MSVNYFSSNEYQNRERMIIESILNEGFLTPQKLYDITKGSPYKMVNILSKSKFGIDEIFSLIDIHFEENPNKFLDRFKPLDAKFDFFFGLSRHLPSDLVSDSNIKRILSYIERTYRGKSKDIKEMFAYGLFGHNDYESGLTTEYKESLVNTYLNAWAMWNNNDSIRHNNNKAQTFYSHVVFKPKTLESEFSRARLKIQDVLDVIEIHSKNKNIKDPFEFYGVLIRNLPISLLTDDNMKMILKHVAKIHPDKYEKQKQKIMTGLKLNKNTGKSLSGQFIMKHLVSIKKGILSSLPFGR
jgi:hypothetical protein